MFRQLVLTAVASACLLSGIACKNCGKRSSRNDPPPPPPGGNPYLDPPVAPGGTGSFPPPFPSADRIPPPSVPTTPGDSGPFSPPPEIPDSRGSMRIDPTLPPPPLSADLPPPPASIPAPSGNGDRSPPPPLPKSNKELLLPDPLPGSAPATAPSSPTDTLIGKDTPPRSQSPSAILEDPIRPLPESTNRVDAAKPSFPPPAISESPPPSNNDVPPLNRSLPPTPQSPPPPSSSSSSASPITKAPVGVPEFQAVGGFTDVYVGRRPKLDGFEALKSAGIRTVLYLHGPDADVSAAKELAEKSGLRFESLAVSPQTLATASESFNTIVASKGYRPLFISDDTGERTGALWYLYFRKVELLGDGAAQVRATPLGFRNPETWLAEIPANRR